MNPDKVLPERAFTYVHDIGVRAIDQLAEKLGTQPAEAEGVEPGEPSGVEKLAEQWRGLTVEEKEDFVHRLVAAVVEVAAVAAVAPMGLKLGKRAAKATGKVIRKKTKKLRKVAKNAFGDEPKARGGKKKKKA